MESLFELVSFMVEAAVMGFAMAAGAAWFERLYARPEPEPAEPTPKPKRRKPRPQPKPPPPQSWSAP